MSLKDVHVYIQWGLVLHLAPFLTLLGHASPDYNHPNAGEPPKKGPVDTGVVVWGSSGPLSSYKVPCFLIHLLALNPHEATAVSDLNLLVEYDQERPRECVFGNSKIITTIGSS